MSIVKPKYATHTAMKPCLNAEEKIAHLLRHDPLLL